ncbi:unnamed protein product [Parajaminaea phylloscopi]
MADPASPVAPSNVAKAENGDNVNVRDSGAGRKQAAAGKVKAPKKKGANPLKAKLKAAAASIGARDDAEETALRNGPQSAQFQVEVQSPLVTLLYHSASAQHRALSRMEAFYEGASSSHRYLTLAEAASERLCRNYEAFNLPVSSLQEWLQAMAARHEQDGDGVKSWRDCVNAEERHLLDELIEVGVLATLGDESGADVEPRRAPPRDASAGSCPPPPPRAQETGVAGNASDRTGEGPLTRSAASSHDAAPATATATTTDSTNTHTQISYIISCLASQQAKSLPHERLHALYHLCPQYRTAVSRGYAQLSRRACKAVETELGLRGYGPRVWEDEWQAYVVDGDTSIGGGAARRENEELRAGLRVEATEAGKRVGLAV